jgi:hypothetical protein
MNEIWERVLANSFSGIHKSKIICSVGYTAWQNWFLGIDSWASSKFKNSGSAGGPVGTPYSSSVPSPHRMFKNSSSGHFLVLF